MRVDLVSKRFCLDKCEETLPIQDVTLSHIILFDVKTGTGRERFSWTISRETGGFFATTLAENGDLTSSLRGSCQKTAFKGFPPQRF